MTAETMMVTISSSSPWKGSLLSGGVGSVIVFLAFGGFTISGFVVVVGIGVRYFAGAF